MAVLPTESVRTVDLDTELPYIIWNYYEDCLAVGEIATWELATELFLEDMAERDG